jgi:aryl-alcohol dehydrogenase-like predicted oxidoreductase
MEYQFLGRTGVQVSRLAFGTMSFGGDADEATSIAMFQKCRDVGINVFDCADVYAKGRSEEILGRCLKGCRDEVILTSKAYFPTSQDINARGASRYHLVRAVEDSLKRLGTDRIDIFFLHRFDEQTALDETLQAVEDLVIQGKILYPAVSNFSAWQTMKALGLADIGGWSKLVCIQPMYNLLKRQAESEILPMAAAEGLAVLTYSPLAGGLLSGKYRREQKPSSGRLVENAMYQTRYGAPGYYETAERFTDLAKARGHHPVPLAIRWVAHHPAVTAPLIGARNIDQLNMALGALDIDMDDELYQEIAVLSPAPSPATDRNEEGSAHNYGSRQGAGGKKG